VQDADGDTEPGTDVEAETATVGSKRKAPTAPRYTLKFSLHFLHFNGAYQVEAVESYRSF